MGLADRGGRLGGPEPLAHHQPRPRAGPRAHQLERSEQPAADPGGAHAADHVKAVAKAADLGDVTLDEADRRLDIQLDGSSPGGGQKGGIDVHAHPGGTVLAGVAAQHLALSAGEI
jgi:hypothetical protein